MITLTQILTPEDILGQLLNENDSENEVVVEKLKRSWPVFFGMSKGSCYLTTLKKAKQIQIKINN